MNNIDRFSHMENDYSKYRPNYSSEAINYIISKYILNNNSVIADVGAGTGKLCLPFLEKGITVYGIEPNYDMFHKCLENLGSYSNFKGVNCSAEAIDLTNNSVDLVTVGQAFHWFDAGLFKNECTRILKENPVVAIIYNNGDYDKKIIKEIHSLSSKYCPEYKGSSGGLNRNEEIFNNFFLNYEKIIFKNDYVLNKEQFIGLNFSASYAPKQNSENYTIYLNELERIFDKYSENGYITMPNNTILRIGNIK